MAFSIYALTITTKLSIPLPALTSTLSLILPLLTPGALFFQGRNLNRKISLRLPQFIFLVTIILDTILLTYAVSALNPTFLGCQLETQWLTLFRHNNNAAIRGIQDRLECCGFRTLVHNAWPFPIDSDGRADACKRAFPRRERACMNGLMVEERKILGIMIAVGGVSLLSKVRIIRFFHSFCLSDSCSLLLGLARNCESKKKWIETSYRLYSSSNLPFSSSSCFFSTSPFQPGSPEWEIAAAIMFCLISIPTTKASTGFLHLVDECGQLGQGKESETGLLCREDRLQIDHTLTMSMRMGQRGLRKGIAHSVGNNSHVGKTTIENNHHLLPWKGKDGAIERE